jgi:hypothetical protein
LVDPTIVKHAKHAGTESQDQIRKEYGALGIRYKGEAVWDPVHKTWASKKDHQDTEKGEEILATGTRTTSDAMERRAYEVAIKERSQSAVKSIEELRKTDRPGDALKAWEEAESASEFRAKMRETTRTKLTRAGRAISEKLDETHPPEFYANKYSSPPEVRSNIKVPEGPPATETRIGAPDPQGTYVYDVAEEIAGGAGRSRGGLAAIGFRAARILGPVGIGIGAIFSGFEIYKAPSGQRARAAAVKTGSFVGVLAGAELGSAITLGIATVLMAANPVGWAAISIAVVGALIGGYAGSKAGATWANAIFNLF